MGEQGERDKERERAHRGRVEGTCWLARDVRERADVETEAALLVRAEVNAVTAGGVGCCVCVCGCEKACR